MLDSNLGLCSRYLRFVYYGFLYFEWLPKHWTFFWFSWIAQNAESSYHETKTI